MLTFYSMKQRIGWAMLTFYSINRVLSGSGEVFATATWPELQIASKPWHKPTAGLDISGNRSGEEPLSIKTCVNFYAELVWIR